MARLKKDWFEPQVRMTHRFGESIADDPLGRGSVNVQVPVFPTQSSPGINRKRDGEYRWDNPRSPVVKPSGFAASFNGPKPDYASEFAVAVPTGTKKRKSLK